MKVNHNFYFIENLCTCLCQDFDISGTACSLHLTYVRTLIIMLSYPCYSTYQFFIFPHCKPCGFFFTIFWKGDVISPNFQSRNRYYILFWHHTSLIMCVFVCGWGGVSCYFFINILIYVILNCPVTQTWIHSHLYLINGLSS